MTDTGQIQIARFGILPLRPHTLRIADFIAIDDNFDTYENIVTDEDQRILPTKMLLSMVAVIVEGEAKLKVNQEEFTIRKNDILVETPGSIWEGIKLVRNCKCIFMAMNPEHAAWTPLKSVEDIRKSISQTRTPAVIHCSQEVTDELVSMYLTMRGICAQVHEEYSYDAVAGFIISMSSLIASHVKDNPLEKRISSVTDKHKSLLIKFSNDIHEFCGKERSVSFYADRCCLSPKYFARIIMEAAGMKPGEMIKNAVILEAKVLLASDKYSVQQVSDKLNFANSSFFCKYFKSATGMSPKNYLAYRKRDISTE